MNRFSDTLTTKLQGIVVRFDPKPAVRSRLLIQSANESI
jgi:hypothetical protein